MTKREVCFAVVFNHRYDENIPKLEKIYADRFDSLFFLVPFYTGDQPNVLSVYENSIFFHGFFAQAYERLFSERYSHYVFIADDLILHPRLNADNLIDELRLGDDAGYITHLVPLADQTFKWDWQMMALDAIKNSPLPRATFEQELPSLEEARARAEAHRVRTRDLAWGDLKALRGGRYREYVRPAKFLWKHRRDLSLPYPYVVAYSDLIVVPRHALRQFCHYCGVFAAMNLFVEVAAPTALMLACERIVVETDTDLHGRVLWEQDEVTQLLAEHDYDLRRILDSYEDDQMFLHPLKLSKLKFDNFQNDRAVHHHHEHLSAD